MSLVRAQDLALEFGGNYILRDVNCSLEQNSRVGLIGGNGSGKTTLIKLILGIQQPTSGAVVKARNCKIAYLPQNFKLDQNRLMLDYVKDSRPDLRELSQQIESLSQALADGYSESLENSLNARVEHYTALGGYEFDNELKYVLTSLDFPPTEWHKRCGDFSGGEQTRICLAAILLQQYELLILDEPTNHLDLAMIDWLEKYLLKQTKPFLVVSHDRRFLDNTVSTIWCLRQGSISITKGNYSSFKAADEIARLSQQREYERQQKFISETQAYIQKFIAGTRSGSAKSRLKMLNRLEIVKKPGETKALKIELAVSKRSGNDIFTLKNLSFGIPGVRELARDIDLKVHYQDRICIMGPNGCGKTTLLKILLGEHEISGGTLKTGASLDVGYFDQHQVQLAEDLSVMDTIWQLVPHAPQGYVLSWLARFGFRGDEVDKMVSVLSGGEKSRLYLCQLIHQNPNLLIMDEPTNHLDIDMADALLEALKQYKGTVIFVSHDRWFLSELASKFWVFTKVSDAHGIHTTIVEPDCDWQQAIALAFSEPEKEKTVAPPREKKKKINPWYLEQLHLRIEEQQQILARHKNDLESIHFQLSDSATYNDQGRVLSLQKEMSSLEEQIQAIQTRLNELEDQYLIQSYEES